MYRLQEGFRGRRGVLAVIVLVLVMACAAALAATSYPFTTVTSDKVNLRRSASSNATILDRIEKGASIEVQGESGSYYKVAYDGRTGYVLKEYVVSEGDSVVTPTPVAGYPYETTTNASVNLRSEQSVHSDLLKKIPEGATVTVQSVSTNGTFAKITYDGAEGYCKKEFLNLKTVAKATPTPTATPVIAAEEDATGYVILQKGDTGSAVTALQSALIELGFLSGEPDGKFGGGTETAVMAFQEKNGYPTTGVVDANLQAHLYSGTPLNSAGKKTSVTTLAPVSGVTIRLNNKGELVVTVQTRLKELGYYTGDITGVYDSATKKACAAFQKKNGLTSDGLCGATTQNALLSGEALSADATPTPTPAPATPTPSPVPTFTTPSAMVRDGSTGADATLVQTRLKELGYLSGKVDGKFGPTSVEALKAFQEKNGLKADGVAGTGTFAVLFSVNALSVDALPTPGPTAILTPAPATATPTPTPLTEANCVLVTLGVEGDAVRALQERLTALGYYNATTDGKCKVDDVAAIKAFQEANGLKVDGKAGYGTQSKMYSVSAIMYSGTIAGGAVDSFTTLRKGMSGDDVKAMQERLIELGFLSGKADGNFGTSTAEAVVAFQRANGLVRDGVAGSTTLTKLYAATAATPTPAVTATPAPTTSTGSLAQGAAGDAVKTLQARLIELGYLSGKADGKFGVQTYLALVAFQRANKLTADGIAGTMTMNLLTSGSAVSANGATATTAPTAAPSTNNGSSYRPTASAVRYANWYSEIKARAKLYPYATVYDFTTGLSWQVHMFSLGAHADSEPLTAADTAKMEKAFGGNTWNPKAVWVIFGDGRIYMASTHSMPHEVQHITDNNFAGHLCIHFPRTAAQVTAIGPYATSHQKAIDAGWSATQAMIN